MAKPEFLNLFRTFLNAESAKTRREISFPIILSCPPSQTRVNIQATKMTSEPTLLPVWIMAYRFRDGVVCFLVNGQTGKATGQVPISYTKILGAILIAVLAVLLVLLLAGVVKAVPCAIMLGVLAGRSADIRRSRKSNAGINRSTR